jgi:hypothetical protein
MVQWDHTDQTGDRPERSGGGIDESGSLVSTNRRTLLATVAAGATGGLVSGSGVASGGSSRSGDESALDLVPESDVTHRAVQSGAWNEPSVWEDGAVPTADAHVLVEEDVTVTVASEETTRLRTIRVDGTLSFDPTVDTRLPVDTLVTASGSTLQIGTPESPIQSGVRARITFADTGPIDETWDPERKSRGLLAMGDVTIHGSPKTEWTPLANFPASGDRKLSLPEAPSNWEPGDRIVVPGIDPRESQDEERSIEAVEGSTVRLDEALQYDHAPPASDLDAYALNLSRNVVLESESEETPRRGHVMIMSTESEVRYVRFGELGRTDKREYITNPVRNEDALPDGLDPNPTARYPLHWHRTGSDATNPHVVEGVVVDGSPGWGVVNHHAYADVTDSITYDVVGAGFVAEGGNERGSYKRNFALRSEGSGETIDSRSAGQNGHGGDPPIDDFGHAGHGFWSQSPLVEMVDNVAAGHRHFGFVYWTRPLLDSSDQTLAESTPDTIADSRVTFVPNLPMDWLEGRQDPMLEAIREQRFSTDSADRLMWETQKVPSCFALLRRVEGNTAFASGGGLDVSRNHFKWNHERFSDFSTVEDMTVHSIGPFVDADGDVHEPGPPRHLASGHQGRGGNVGVSFRYMSNVSLVDSALYGGGTPNGFAVPYHDYLWTVTVDGCTIENWDWGVVTGEHRLTWVRNNSFDGNNVDVHWSFDNAGSAVVEGNDLSTVRNEFQYLNQKATEVFGFDQKRGVRVDGRSAHVEASTPDFVPFPDADSLGGVNNLDDVFDDPSAIVGMTAQEIWDQHEEAIGGHLLPDDAVPEPYVDGSLLGPEGGRNPPTGVYLDTANAPTLGAFEVVDEPDASSDTAVRATGSSSPRDEPLALSFDCAAGTYRLFARVWPDAWNGDTVSFRIDGGEWKHAEKLKSPIGFEWHDAELNGGDEYTWDLAEGTHTLEIACGNDGVLLDEVFVTSDSQVLGGYGQSAGDANESDESPEQAPYADHDLSRIEAEDFDTGGEGVAYNDDGDGNAGGAYRDTNVDIEETTDEGGGYNVGWIGDGEWWEYTVEIPDGGEYDLSARLAGKNATTLDVAVDGSKVATVDVPNTGGWQTWETVDAGSVTLDSGTHTIRLTANGDDFNINWFGFEEATAGKEVAVTGAGTSSYNDGTRIRYVVETTGTIESSGTGDLETEDRWGGSAAAGRVAADGSDTDTFSLTDGDVTDISTWGGDVTVTVDGSEWTG